MNTPVIAAEAAPTIENFNCEYFTQLVVNITPTFFPCFSKVNHMKQKSNAWRDAMKTYLCSLLICTILVDFFAPDSTADTDLAAQQWSLNHLIDPEAEQVASISGALINS